MRINLTTPFAEKDAVKALGARWDSAKKVWYIVDVADLTPFMRWIPDLQSATAPNPVSSPSAGKTGKPPAPAPSAKGTVTQPSGAVAHCGCAVLPWEACPHTPSI